MKGLGAAMDGSNYQLLAMRTNDHHSTDRLDAWKTAMKGSTIDPGGVMYACLGLSGEVGEVIEIVKKWVFHKKPIDLLHMEKEVGDIMWYIAMICDSMGFDLDRIMAINIEKLKQRYPDGFSTEASNNRREGDI